VRAVAVEFAVGLLQMSDQTTGIRGFQENRFAFT
jgi:hypothetical protein